MKRSLHASIVIAVLLLMLLAAQGALAQQPGGQCGGAGTTIITAAVVPASGIAGSSAVAGGQVSQLILTPGLNPGQQVNVLWDDSTSLATLTVDSNYHFGGNITIPAGASPGTHTIYLRGQGEQDPFCLAFDVTAAVRQDAYPVSRTSMPSTGAFLLLPLAGLLAGACGAAVLGARRR